MKRDAGYTALLRRLRQSIREEIGAIEYDIGVKRKRLAETKEYLRQRQREYAKLNAKITELERERNYT